MKNKAWCVLLLLFSAIVCPSRVAYSADLIPVNVIVEGFDDEAMKCQITSVSVESRVRLVLRQYGLEVTPMETQLTNPIVRVVVNIMDKSDQGCFAYQEIILMGITADDIMNAPLGWVKKGAELRFTTVANSGGILTFNPKKGTQFFLSGIEEKIKDTLGKIIY